MILLIDNYDSFTYNLAQRIGEVFLGSNGGAGARPSARQIPEIRVVRNDKITVGGAAALEPTHLILSPGPCTPTESGVCPQLIEHFMGKIPILGVCLGHQAVGHVRGMTVKRHHTIMHGKTSQIHHDGHGIYEGLSNPFTATRYHSLIVARETVPADFEVSAWTKEGDVMGLRWAPGNLATKDRGREQAEDSARSAPLDGVQFHPESFLTVEGPKLLANFLAGASSPLRS